MGVELCNLCDAMLLCILLNVPTNPWSRAEIPAFWQRCIWEFIERRRDLGAKPNIILSPDTSKLACAFEEVAVNALFEKDTSSHDTRDSSSNDAYSLHSFHPDLDL